jgi:4-amino-4-deoxy-L-arabinose transferase-like glycosyltransferase
MAKQPGTTLQDVVYNLDVGIGLQMLRAALYIGGVLVVMLWYTAGQFRGLDGAEAMDAAQLGRNIAVGRGYTTRNVQPASIGFLQARNPARAAIDFHPEITRPPVYPMLLAAGFRVIRGAVLAPAAQGVYPPEQWVVVPVNHSFSLLSGLLVLLLGQRLFDRRIGFLAMTAYFLSDAVWQHSLQAEGVALLIFFATAAFWLMLLASDLKNNGRKRIVWLLPFLAATGFCVAAFLTRYLAVVLMPGLALLVFLRFGKGRGWLLGLFLLLFAAGIAPWIARNILVCRAPLGMAPYLFMDGEHRLISRTLTPGFSWRTFFGAPITRHWMTNAADVYKNHLPRFGEGFLGVFFVASFFYSFVRHDVRDTRWAAALSIALLAAFFGFTGPESMDVLMMFFPLLIVYGLAFFFLLLERLQLQARVFELGLITLVMLFSAAPLAFTLAPPRAGTPYPPYYPPFVTYTCNLLQNDELVCTDMPWATAWYADQASIELPVNVEEFYTINDYYKPVSGLYFTTVTRNLPFVRTLRTGPYKTWYPIMEGRLPQDFPLTSGFPLNNLDQLFLTDYARWEQPAAAGGGGNAAP